MTRFDVNLNYKSFLNQNLHYPRSCFISAIFLCVLGSHSKKFQHKLTKYFSCKSWYMIFWYHLILSMNHVTLTWTAVTPTAHVLLTLHKVQGGAHDHYMSYKLLKMVISSSTQTPVKNELIRTRLNISIYISKYMEVKLV